MQETVATFKCYLTKLIAGLPLQQRGIFFIDRLGRILICRASLNYARRLFVLLKILANIFPFCRSAMWPWNIEFSVILSSKGMFHWVLCTLRYHLANKPYYWLLKIDDWLTHCQWWRCRLNTYGDDDDDNIIKLCRAVTVNADKMGTFLYYFTQQTSLFVKPDFLLTFCLTVCPNKSGR